MRQSPLFVKAFDLMQWLVPRTLAFPKSQRGVLARQVQEHVFALYEALVDAGLADEPLPHLRQADANLAKLRSYLRLSHELSLLSTAQYGYASQQMAEVGRLLGAWIRTLDGEAGPPTGRPRSKAVSAA